MGAMRPVKRVISPVLPCRGDINLVLFLANGPETLPCAFLYLLLTVFDVISGHSRSFPVISVKIEIAFVATATYRALPLKGDAAHVSVYAVVTEAEGAAQLLAAE